MEGVFEDVLGFFFFWFVMLPFAAWAVMERKDTRNPVFDWFKLTRTHAIGWAVYLCLAVIISAVVLVSEDARPTQSTADSIPDLVGQTYRIDATQPGNDPAVTQLLADGDTSVEPMSICFINDTEVQIVYLGETYSGRFTKDGGGVDIETDAPTFHEGLSGVFGKIRPVQLPGSRSRRMEIWGQDIFLSLHSGEFNYILLNAPDPQVPAGSEQRE